MVTGFTDAEGCFLVLVRKSPKNKLGWQFEVNFTINLHVRDIELLKLIQAYFWGVPSGSAGAWSNDAALVGRISKERNNCCDFTIGYLYQILTKVIPHFDNIP